MLKWIIFKQNHGAGTKIEILQKDECFSIILRQIFGTLQHEISLQAICSYAMFSADSLFQLTNDWLLRGTKFFLLQNNHSSLFYTNRKEKELSIKLFNIYNMFFEFLRKLASLHANLNYFNFFNPSWYGLNPIWNKIKKLWNTCYAVI